MTTTIQDLRKWKAERKRFTMLTAYDYTTARWLERAGIPVILVGDSLGNTMLGYPDTLSVTMDDMIRHAGAVVRGAPSALIIGDMPFMSYHACAEDAVRNAGRFLQEARVQAVKMEGGGRVIAYTKQLTAMGIPVMGHLGLTPSFVNQFGGYRVQGRSDEAAERILADAQALEDAGAFAVVLEGVPSPLGKRVTEALSIPTIGIGAGVSCDAQVLVIQDVLGLTTEHVAKFVKQYAQLGPLMESAVRAFDEDVRQGAFPTPEHEYSPNPR
ncbi:MAG TPA: 3-methyl-2-oxobutanoate hydroxymethyltransferase [Candidatus Limnocylindrales bacterium]|nr:3-methyl-2-oxobutanoate hydroxymethyltransferase [Candidatus Limnocylindrales bacterium]